MYYFGDVWHADIQMYMCRCFLQEACNAYRVGVFGTQVCSVPGTADARVPNKGTADLIRAQPMHVCQTRAQMTLQGRSRCTCAKQGHRRP